MRPGNEAFSALSLAGREMAPVRLASLMAGGRPLAMSSWFVTGDRGFGFKMAFDEGFRAYAPGRLLMHDVADRIGQNPAMHFDTCAPATACSGQSPWVGKQTIFDCAIGGRAAASRCSSTFNAARDAYAAVMPGMKRLDGAWRTPFGEGRI